MSYSPRERAFHDGRIARSEGTDSSIELQDDELRAAWQEGWKAQDEIARLRKEIPLDDALIAAVRKFSTANVIGSPFSTRVDFLDHTINLWEWRRLMHRYGPTDATRLIIDDIMTALQHRQERDEYKPRYRAENENAVIVAMRMPDGSAAMEISKVVSAQAEVESLVEPLISAEREEPAETLDTIAKRRRRVAAPPRAKSKDRR